MTTETSSNPTPAAIEHAPALPSPAERPGAAVLIFDGQCRMCIGQVTRIYRLDRGGRLAFLSLHDPTVATEYPDLTHEAMMEEMVVVDQQGRRHWGAGAFRYLTRRLPLLWPLAPLMHIPLSMPLWRFLYRQVAKRRYFFGRIEPCTDDACSIHHR